MFYAVTVALLIGSVSSSIILLDHHQNLRASRVLAREHARDLALAALYTAPTLTAGEPSWRGWLDPFRTGQRSVEVQVEPWGLFEAVSATATHADRTVKATGLRGRYLDTTSTLRIDRRAGLLHMCGDARVRGRAYLPRTEVRRGHIAGRPFTGHRLIDATVHLSAAHPAAAFNTSMHERVRHVMVHLGRTTADPVTASGHLNDPGLAQQVVIVSRDTLVIGPACALRNAIIRAPFIRLLGGVRGSVQCFADRGIRVDSAAVLEFPSALCTVRGPQDARVAPIVIASGAQVQGTVLALDASIRGKAEPIVVLEHGAVLDGELFAQGAADVRGMVHGRVIVGSLSVRTDGSLFGDHLLDGEIGPARTTLVSAGTLEADREPSLLTWSEIP
ncbi:MAG: hypothetical protein IPM49_06540 [Flavobacteriales bacterium]|nr:hypothetical protein [Flavobacteriales bacterium]